MLKLNVCVAQPQESPRQTPGPVITGQQPERSRHIAHSGSVTVSERISPGCMGRSPERGHPMQESRSCRVLEMSQCCTSQSSVWEYKGVGSLYLGEFGQCKNAPYGIVNSLRPARMLRYVSTCDVVRFRCDDTSITRNKDYRPLFFPLKSSHGIWVPSWGRSIPHVCSIQVAALLMP